MTHTINPIREVIFFHNEFNIDATSLALQLLYRDIALRFCFLEP